MTVARLTDTALDAINMLERQDEFAVIERTLDAADAGRGEFLVLEGPAGIGKTALLHVGAGAGKARGMTVLAARGSALEGDFSFGVVQQLFEPLGLGSPVADRELLDGAASLALRAFGQSLGQGVPSADASFATLHGLYWLVANLSAQTPVLLLVDDCHWADGPSLRFLAFLGARLDELRVVALVARRTGDPAAEPELLLELLGLAGGTLRPALLGPSATARLVREMVGEQATERFCAACHAATGGNPLLVRTLVAGLGAEGVPETDEAVEQVGTFGLDAVASLLTQQLARFPPGADAVARALTVLGDGAPLRQVSTLARLPLDATAVLADSLRSASILAPGSELRFAHPILRAAVEDAMGEDERALAHAKATAVLAADGAPPDRLALHLIRTHPVGDPDTAATLQQAARLAVQRGALDIAGQYLVRALAEPPPTRLRGSLLVELGLAYLAERRGSQAIQLLTDGVATIHVTERPAAALLAGRALGIAGHFVEAAAVLESAVPASGPRTDVELIVEAELLANSWLLADRARAAWDRVGQYQEESAPPGVGRDLMRVHLAVRALGRAGSQASGSALLDRVLASSSIVDEETLVLAWATMMLVATDRFDDADQILSALMRESERRGAASLVAHLGFPRAIIACRLGRLREAEAYARWSLEQKLARGMSAGRAWHLAPLLDALVAQGDLDGAELALAQADVPSPAPADMGWAMALEARGRLRLGQGRPREALADLLDAGTRWGQLPWSHPGLALWRVDAAAAQLQLGNHTEAGRLAAQQLELAQATELPRLIAGALIAKAATQQRPEARALLQQAVDLLEPLSARLELGHAHVELGSVLRRDGKRLEAQDHLRRGLEFAHRAGAAPLAARARDELVAAGGRPRRPAISGVEALTASELRVARLAAEGATNRDIAQRLFVTQKTVETHLRHVFQKLGVRGRDELPRELARD